MAGVVNVGTAESPGTGKRLFRWSSKRKLHIRVSEKSEFEELLGRGLCPEGRRGHKSREAVEARRALREWLREGGTWTLAASWANDPNLIRFPERFVEEEDATCCYFECVVRGTSIRCSRSTTVGELSRQVCSGEECFLLKAVGRLQFLLRNQWRLVDYEYVWERARNEAPVPLDLVKVDEETSKSLHFLRSISKKDVARLAEYARAPRGDFEMCRSPLPQEENHRLKIWRVQRSFLYAPEHDDDFFSSSDSVSTTVLSSSETPVPLTVTIKRFRMGALTPYRDSVRVRLQVSKRKKKWSRYEQLGHVAKWNPGDTMELSSDARSEPRSTLLHLAVCGDDEHAPPLAHVCVPMFDQAAAATTTTPAPVVRRGECQLRMWPPPPKEQSPAVPSQRWSCVLGENNVDDFGVLTVVFDAPDYYVADDAPSLNDAVDAAEAHLVVENILGNNNNNNNNVNGSEYWRRRRRYATFRSDPTMDERNSEDDEEDEYDEEEPLTKFENQAELTAAVELARARSAEYGGDLSSTSRQQRTRRNSKGVSQAVESVFKSLVSGSKSRHRPPASSYFSDDDDDDYDRRRRSRRPSDSTLYRKMTSGFSSSGRGSNSIDQKAMSFDHTNRQAPSSPVDSAADETSPSGVSRRTPEDSVLAGDSPGFGEEDSLLVASQHPKTRRPSAQMRAVVERVATRQQPLAALTQEDVDALWAEREYASRFPGLLPKWWLAVPKHDRAKLREARVLMARWARDELGISCNKSENGRRGGSSSSRRPSSWSSSDNDPSSSRASRFESGRRRGGARDALSTHARVALELLGHEYADSVVREYACRRLDEMRDDHLRDVVLQLVQSLKLELRHDSALARLLIRRGACSPLDIGHKLFWSLRAEMHDKTVCERLGVVLYGLLAAFGTETRDLLWSECTVDRVLSEVAGKVKLESLKHARGRARDFLRHADRELKRHVEQRKRRLMQRIAQEREEPNTTTTTTTEDAHSPPFPQQQLSASPLPQQSPPPPPPPPPSGGNTHSPPRSASHSAKKHLVSSLTTWSSAFAAGAADFRHSSSSSVPSAVSLCCGFSSCLDPTWRCKGIDVSKCRVLSSKKQPLHVVLKNADGAAGGSDDLHVIYKHGDDLRQDQLTLQLVGLMDDMWRRQGLDLQMCPYRCVASGDSRGMIEVVRNARTTADIQVEFGRGARGAFKDNVVSLYLEAHNADSRKFERARSTFVSSCSGYCVATHVLGVGDRHADNIMVAENGRLFHIDFGHFLGNFKDKFGIKRERSPFVFTPDMKNVMSAQAPDHHHQASSARRKMQHVFTSNKTTAGGAAYGGGLVASSHRRRRRNPSSPPPPRDGSSPHLGYHDFENFCCDAYNAVRDRAESFVVLFTLMLPAEMPELMQPDDVAYMVDQLALDLSPAKAAEKFRGDINNAHRDIWRRVDNYLHNKKHNAPKAAAAAAAAAPPPPPSSATPGTT